MTEVILYTTHCPKCRILENELSKKKIDFTIIDDVDYMIQKGVSSIPMMEINGKLKNYNEAIRWIMNGGQLIEK